MIKQVGPLRGRPITRMITDQIGLHSVLLPLLITKYDFVSIHLLNYVRHINYRRPYGPTGAQRLDDDINYRQYITYIRTYLPTNLPYKSSDTEGEKFYIMSKTREKYAQF